MKNICSINCGVRNLHKFYYFFLGIRLVGYFWSLFTWIQEGEKAHNVKVLNRFISKRKYTLIALNFYFTGEKNDQSKHLRFTNKMSYFQMKNFSTKSSFSLRKYELKEKDRLINVEDDFWQKWPDILCHLKRKRQLNELISSEVSIIVKPFAGSGPIS